MANINECNNCPEGFTWDPDLGSCVKEETALPSYSGSLVTIGQGSTSAAYGWGGLRLYEDITNKTFPIVGTGNTNATYSLTDNNGTGSPITTIEPGLQNEVWGNTVAGCDPVAQGGGRLNTTGIWSPGYPDNTELCFEFCINNDTLQARQNTIGIAGDNEVRLYIDGQLIVDLSSPGGGVTRPFNYWHVFPFTLTPGQHIIKLCGSNFGDAAAFGAEIYSLTAAQLLANLGTESDAAIPTCGNTPADLAPYILFSTANMIGESVPDPNNLGQWTCPDDPQNPYTLTACDGVYRCERTVLASPGECCYRVQDCNDTTLEYLIKIGECNPQNLNIGEVWKFTYQSGCESPPLDPAKCYKVVEFLSPCPSDNVCNYCPTEQLSSCDACVPCIECENCEDATEKIYFNWAPPPAPQLNYDEVYVFSYDPSKCWKCQPIAADCVPPAVIDVRKQVCTGKGVAIADFLDELVQNSGTYTYEFYIDPTHDTLWAEDINGWTPTNLPNDYVGNVLFLYVLVYEEGCSIPAETTLAVDWIDCSQGQKQRR